MNKVVTLSKKKKKAIINYAKIVPRTHKLESTSDGWCSNSSSLIILPLFDFMRLSLINHGVFFPLRNGNFYYQHRNPPGVFQ